MTAKLVMCASFAVAAAGAFAEGRKWVEWNFDDAKSPLASSGTENLPLSVKWAGRPRYVDGVVGKAVEFPEEEKPFYLEAPIEVGKLLTDGHRSFTAECFVKADGIDYYQFVGTRTVATWYGAAGFSLGCLRTGRLAGVIGNGDVRTFSVIDHLTSSWTPGDWNHLALVRDAETDRVVLYLNGKPTTWSICRKSGAAENSKEMLPVDTTTTRPIHIGADFMTGGRFKGAIDQVRITEGVVSAEEIAARAALTRGRQGKGGLMRVATPVTVADAELPRPVELTLLPRPRTYEPSDEAVRLQSGWKAEGLDARALAALGERLERACGMSTNAPAGVAFRFEDVKPERPEAFEVRGRAVGDGAYEIAVRADGHARYYAMDIVAQLLRKTSLGNGGVLSAPKSFTLADWPSMPRRMSLSAIDYGLRCPDETFDLQGRDMAFMRLNGMHFQIQKAPEARLKAMCDALRHYGVGVMPWYSYMSTKHPITPLSAEDMAEFKAYFDKGGRAGVAGYTIAFDDLNGPFVDILKRADVKTAYGTAGALHNALVGKAVEFSKPYGPKLWQAIPYTYGVDGNGSAKSDYFRDFCKGFDAMDVVTLHTVFSQKGVEELRESGVRKFGYYVNGTWPTPLFFKWYMGPECIPWTWNMFYVDCNGVGPTPYLDMLDEVKHVHERGTVLFGASSAHRSRYIAGWFSWNPAAWDDELAARALTQRFYGSGVHEPLSWYAKLVAPMVGAFMAYKTSWTNESKAPETRRLAPMSKSEIMGYFRNLGKAEKAAALVAAAVASQKTVFDRPELPERSAKQMQKKLVDDMKDTLRQIREKLEKLADR